MTLNVFDDTCGDLVLPPNATTDCTPGRPAGWDTECGVQVLLRV